MLHFLDTILTVVHILIIVFNLFGWIFPATRRTHFICILFTAFCWFVLGIWFGWGYCPVTDWQWSIKEKLGETDLPASFITYYTDKITGRHFSDALVNSLTLILLLSAVIISVYLNFFRKHKEI